MKIILSPSKTAQWTKSPFLSDRALNDPKKTSKLAKKLARLSKKQLKSALKLSDSLVNPTYQAYKQFGDGPCYHAFPSFHGLVFKQLDKTAYQDQEWEYITQHVRILDALYGVLEPGTCIYPYRLDMKAKLGINLYQYWSVSSYFQDDLVINLASNEFSDMVSQDMVTIAFYQCHEGTCKSQATYSKMGRGMMLDYMIKENVTTLAEIKAFNEDGYDFNESLSSTNLVVFSRNQ